MHKNDYHIPVLLAECINGLDINPDGIYVDVTFGGGGHSKAILSQLNNGQLIAFDQDDDAFANALTDKRFALFKSNFKYVPNFLRYYKINKANGILADLGVSSFQIDNPERGFSFRAEAKLDMRMNKSAATSAADILNNYTQEQLKYIFKNYGEIQNAGKIAADIVTYRDNKKMEFISDLLKAIEKDMPKFNQHKYLAPLFQAIRIEVNNELDSLKDLLTSATRILKPEGRLVVLTYHSLEDRLVKNFIKSGNFEGTIDSDIYGNVKTPFVAVNKKVITATTEELEQNNRSRSAKLRIAKRTIYEY